MRKLGDWRLSGQRDDPPEKTVEDARAIAAYERWSGEAGAWRQRMEQWSTAKPAAVLDALTIAVGIRRAAEPVQELTAEVARLNAEAAKARDALIQV